MWTKIKMLMEQKKVYIDVMGADGFFICQLRYERRGRPKMVDGRIEEVYDLDEIRSFVYEKRPSLINKDIRLAISNNRVI